MNSITVRPIDCTTDDYQQALSVRNQVLRVPLGLDIKNDDLTGEEQYQHFGAFDNDVLIGTLYLKPLSADTAQIKQVAVLQAKRHGGIGSQLMQAAEAQAKHAGAQQVVLDARIDALPFYKKVGYTVTAQTHTFFNIIHYRMEKAL